MHRYNAGAAFEVKYENFQYSLVASQFDIKYESADYAAGSIMTFVEVADIYKYFPVCMPRLTTSIWMARK